MTKFTRMVSAVVLLGLQDVIVAAAMGVLGLWGGWQIVRQARGELRLPHARHVVAAE